MFPPDLSDITSFSKWESIALHYMAGLLEIVSCCEMCMQPYDQNWMKFASLLFPGENPNL